MRKRKKTAPEEAKATTAPETQGVEVTLKATHTHAGKRYSEGDILTVSEHTARWLIDHGTAVETKEQTP